MNEIFEAGISQWLQATPTGEKSVYKTRFSEHHLGNVWIRSVHGGVTGSMIELCAEAETRSIVEKRVELSVISSSIDYIRITKDSDLYARAEIKRLSRRLSTVDVSCWQDDEDITVARGIVTIKLTQPDS